MKGDFTRDTFAAANHFSRVLMQQGRVTLDADSNEQTSILLHYLTTLARDLIGPYAAPVVEGGFNLSATQEGLLISAGRYYVDGILVENDAPCFYDEQPAFPLPADDPLAKALADRKGDQYWTYLDVWERHITWLEDDRIREKALGGPDTCTRAKVVWQVKALLIESDEDRTANNNKRKALLELRKKQLEQKLAKAKPKNKVRIKKWLAKIDAQLANLNRTETLPPCETPLDQVSPLSEAWLAARVDQEHRIEDACVTPPGSKYRGAENQLYRVEIHQGGLAGTATFKWSRDNGSIVTSWLGTSGYDLKVGNARGFAAGNWVELIDDDAELQGVPGVLVRLAKVEGGTLSVDPDKVSTTDDLEWSASLVNPKVRRWDQVQTEDIVLKAGAVPITETPAGTIDEAATWINLEDDVQVQFAADGIYRSGDYWLIPARVASGNIEWPEPDVEDGKSSATLMPPHGVVHHYAPLGIVLWENDNLSINTCRCDFEPGSSCFTRAGIRDEIMRSGAVVTPPTRAAGATTPVVKPKAKRKSPKRGGRKSAR